MFLQLAANAAARRPVPGRRFHTSLAPYQQNFSTSQQSTQLQADVIDALKAAGRDDKMGGRGFGGGGVCGGGGGFSGLS